MFSRNLLNYVYFIALFLLSCSSPPVGIIGESVEGLAGKLLNATNIDLWNKTAAVSFSWKGGGEHHYLWDKQRKFVEVRWGDTVVQYRQKKGYQGIVFMDGKRLQETQKIRDIIARARKYFVNDLFWLNPVFHFNSPGVQKSKISDNELLITFRQGGITPGDSYLFKLDKNNLIEEMKMWVSILPIKGVSVKFSNYITTETNVKLALNHKITFLNIQIKDVKMYDKYPLGNKDNFEPLLLEL